MKFEPSYDNIPRANFTLRLRFTKKEVEKIRRILKKKGKRALDIDVCRYITETTDYEAIVNQLLERIYE